LGLSENCELGNASRLNGLEYITTALESLRFLQMVLRSMKVNFGKRLPVACHAFLKRFYVLFVDTITELRWLAYKNSVATMLRCDELIKACASVKYVTAACTFFLFFLNDVALNATIITQMCQDIVNSLSVGGVSHVHGVVGKQSRLRVCAHVRGVHSHTQRLTRGVLWRAGGTLKSSCLSTTHTSTSWSPSSRL
jgi:hypothetical protein